MQSSTRAHFLPLKLTFYMLSNKSSLSPPQPNTKLWDWEIHTTSRSGRWGGDAGDPILNLLLIVTHVNTSWADPPRKQQQWFSRPPHYKGRRRQSVHVELCQVTQQRCKMCASFCLCFDQSWQSTEFYRTLCSQSVIPTHGRGTQYCKKPSFLFSLLYSVPQLPLSSALALMMYIILNKT